MIKSLFVVYCNTMFHVAEAKIIRHILMVLHVETLTHFSVPKRKSVVKKRSIGYSGTQQWLKAIKPHIDN